MISSPGFPKIRHRKSNEKGVEVIWTRQNKSGSKGRWTEIRSRDLY